MFKMNTAAWIGVGGGIAGVLIAIIAVVSVGGPDAIYIALGIISFLAIIFGILFKLLIGPMLNTSRLQKTGISSTATIIEVKDTNVTINNNPQVKLTLELKDDLGQRYTNTYRTVVSRINPFIYKAGMEVPVKVDPKNQKNVVLDFSTHTSSSSAIASSSYSSQPLIDSAVLKSELYKMQQDHDALSLTGRPARALIKTYTWLGAYVNGNNQYVELDLEVLPDNQPAFSGKTKGVISEASVSKYQPGKEVFVKYDLYDNSKIIIDHS